MAYEAPKKNETDAAKPGWKTTEFWLSTIVTVLGIVMASGAIPEASTAATYIGGAMAILAQLGYTGGRSAVKKAELYASAGYDSE